MSPELEKLVETMIRNSADVLRKEPRTDAILLEAWQKPSDRPVLLAQRYRRKPFELIGRVVLVDETI